MKKWLGFALALMLILTTGACSTASQQAQTESTQTTAVPTRTPQERSKRHRELVAEMNRLIDEQLELNKKLAAETDEAKKKAIEALLEANTQAKEEVKKAQEENKKN